jgi:hypothetical protein
MSLAVMLSRSDALHAALAEAVGELDEAPAGLRGSVAMDALMVSAQHGLALRLLMAEDLGVSAMGILRMQYEAVLRAVWALFGASAPDLAKLAAPLTPGTAKAAKSIGMPADLLGAIDKSNAPADLKRSLHEFRSSSWDVLNSYIHAGIHPLRRHDVQHEHELSVGLRMSNGLAFVTCGLMVIVGQRPKRQMDINLVSLRFLDCMPPRHEPA